MNREALVRRWRVFVVGGCVMVSLAGCKPSISIGPGATTIPTPSPPPRPTVTLPAPTQAAPAATNPPANTAATSAPAAAGATSKCVVLALPSLRLRSGPGTTFGVVGSAPNGQSITASGRNGQKDWVQVRTPDGKSAWAAANFLNCSPPLDSLPVATAAPSP